jgi:hypothetical protein
MFPKRSPLDFLFFLGAFLAIESFASGQWIFLLDGIELVIFGVPISSIQNTLLAAGIALVTGSIGFMALGTINSQRKLPSKRLFIDFMIIMGSFLIAVAVSTSESMCLGGCRTSEVDMTYLFTLVGLALCSVGSYSWWQQGMEETAFHWEMISTISTASLLIDLFALSWGGISLPTNLTMVNYLIAGFSSVGIFFGLRGVRSPSDSEMRSESKSSVIEKQIPTYSGKLEE